MEQKKLVDPVEMILDENNNDNIILYNDKDEPIEFEQIAVIPIDTNTYVILQPVKPMKGIGEDEAFAFRLPNREYGEQDLQLVEDDNLIDRIFAEYIDMYKEHKQEQKEEKKQKKNYNNKKN